MRVLTIIKNIKMAKEEKEYQRKIKEGAIKELDPSEKEHQNCVYIQKRLRGILARKRVEELRMEEMVFLGMERKPKTKEEMLNDPIEKKNKTQTERKIIQRKNMEEFDQAKEDLKDEIGENEGQDIKEDMVKKRREWVDEYRASHQGKIPDDLKGFYEKDKVEAPLSPDEEEAKRI